MGVSLSIIPIPMPVGDKHASNQTKWNRDSSQTLAHLEPTSVYAAPWLLAS